MIQDENRKEFEYHEICSKKFFGSKNPPKLEYSQNDIADLAKEIVKSQKTITGVQPKLSLQNMSDDSSVDRLTIVGLWGEYILKPQIESYPELPEIEDLSMHLAESMNIKTVPHSLIRLKSGELAYITRRVDRRSKKGKRTKIHMEDMCQLTERLTEHKYKGSHEQIAKVINKHTANPGLDKVNFYELVLFCYLTGNNDMHLKNFSLLKDENKEYNLSPAYDLVASELVVEGDDEELALTLNAKKKKIKRKDFETAMETSGINSKAAQNILDKFESVDKDWFNLIDKSFLSDTMKQEYKNLIINKINNIYG